MAGFVTLRAASKTDAADLAILSDIAAHGLTSWIWLEDAKQQGFETPMECGRMRMRRDGDRGGWQNAVFAEAYGEIAGASVGYRLSEIGEDVAVDHPALVPVMTLQKKAANHWFIASLGVYSHMRGIGIGSLLLDDQIDKAGGLPVSLITASNNEAALRLYERRDFLEQEREEAAPLYPNGEQHAWVLMTRNVQEQRQVTHG